MIFYSPRDPEAKKLAAARRRREKPTTRRAIARTPSSACHQKISFFFWYRSPDSTFRFFLSASRRFQFRLAPPGAQGGIRAMLAVGVDPS